MKLRVVPAIQGFHWMRSGVQLCLRAPQHFLVPLVLCLIAAMVLLLLPILGAIMVVMAMPVVWMAFMQISRLTLSGESLSLGLLLDPLRDPEQRRQWLKLGALYAGATIVVQVLAATLGPGMEELAQVVETAPEGAQVLDSDVVLSSMLWRLVLTLPVSLLFWHTPALLHWARVPVGKALFFSAVASWRNLGAFLVYGASWAGLLLLIGLPVQLLATVIPEPLIVNMAAVAAGLWVASAFYASLYFSVIECFEEPQPADATPPSDA